MQCTICHNSQISCHFHWHCFYVFRLHVTLHRTGCRQWRSLMMTHFWELKTRSTCSHVRKTAPQQRTRSDYICRKLDSITSANLSTFSDTVCPLVWCYVLSLLQCIKGILWGLAKLQSAYRECHLPFTLPESFVDVSFSRSLLLIFFGLYLYCSVQCSACWTMLSSLLLLSFCASTPFSLYY